MDPPTKTLERLAAPTPYICMLKQPIALVFTSSTLALWGTYMYVCMYTILLELINAYGCPHERKMDGGSEPSK